ncbi:MAG: hypothetical protein IPP32_12855 [Bacteroidetes bacterium]|nr:hypothetical protein [Bacteroidota bacterium]
MTLSEAKKIIVDGKIDNEFVSDMVDEQIDYIFIASSNNEEMMEYLERLIKSDWEMENEIPICVKGDYSIYGAADDNFISARNITAECLRLVQS